MDKQGMAGMRPQWEHHVEYIKAKTYLPQTQDFLAQYYPKQKIPAYAVEAILPRINELGEQGWELIQMQPVNVGDNGDIQVGGGSSWTNMYLCAFKRLKRSAQS